MGEGNALAGMKRQDDSRCSDVRYRERGTGRLKAIIWLAILGTIVYMGIKVVPVLLNDYQFEDAMKTTTRFASVNRQSAEEVREAVLKEAARADVPIRREDIRVSVGGGNVSIEANYSVTVDLQLYQWTLNFHSTASNNSL